MTRPISISDHALLRFLERAGGVDVEGLRETLQASLARAHEAARALDCSEYAIKADGLLVIVRCDVVTTVLDDNGPRQIAHAIRPREFRP